MPESEVKYVLEKNEAMAMTDILDIVHCLRLKTPRFAFVSIFRWKGERRTSYGGPFKEFCLACDDGPSPKYQSQLFQYTFIRNRVTMKGISLFH